MNENYNTTAGFSVVPAKNLKSRCFSHSDTYSLSKLTGVGRTKSRDFLVEMFYIKTNAMQILG